METTLESLAKGKYISLTTFRKDGTAVATPVWLVREGDRLLVTTQGSSGKARRIRNNSRVLIAPCTMRGKPTGEAIEATAQVLDPQESERVSTLVAKRYGLMGRFLTKRGDAADRVGIVVTVT